MTIKQRSSYVIERTTIIPEIMEVLSADFQLDVMYNRELKLRQPIGIYNVSYLSLLSGFERVLDELEKLIQSPFTNDKDIPPEWTTKGPHEPKLLIEQRGLLYALMEHMDDCENILKCFAPPTSNEPQKRTLPTYAKYSPIKACAKSVKPYYDHISRIVNHSKHHQGRLRAFIISSPTMSLPGYFVESCETLVNPVTKEILWEVIGPSSVIHGESRETAFSFARDIRFHFVHMYIVAMHLSEAVRLLSKGKSSPRTIDHSEIAERTINIARRIEKLPMYFFRDEVNLDTPTVRVKESNGSMSIRLAYHDNNSVLLSLETGKRYMALVSYRGDASTVSMKLPYLL